MCTQSVLLRFVFKLPVQKYIYLWLNTLSYVQKTYPPSQDYTNTYSFIFLNTPLKLPLHLGLEPFGFLQWYEVILGFSFYLKTHSFLSQWCFWGFRPSSSASFSRPRDEEAWILFPSPLVRWLLGRLCAWEALAGTWKVQEGSSHLLSCSHQAPRAAVAAGWLQTKKLGAGFSSTISWTARVLAPLLGIS